MTPDNKLLSFDELRKKEQGLLPPICPGCGWTFKSDAALKTHDCADLLRRGIRERERQMGIPQGHHDTYAGIGLGVFIGAFIVIALVAKGCQ